MAKKQTTKKTTQHKKAEINIPKGYTIVPLSDMEDSHDFEKIPVLEGKPTGIKPVTVHKGKKNEYQSRILGVQTEDGVVKGVWESSKLTPFFNKIEADLKKKKPEISSVYIQYLGLVDVGQAQPMKDFAVAIQ